MILAEREAQIIRIQSQDSQPELLAALEATLKREVMMVTKSTIEATLVEELEAERKTQTGPQPRRSGYFSRVLDTEYGRIDQFQVPKLRWGIISLVSKRISNGSKRKRSLYPVLVLAKSLGILAVNFILSAFITLVVEPSPDGRFHFMCENCCLKWRKFVESISFYVRTHMKSCKDRLQEPYFQQVNEPD